VVGCIFQIAAGCELHDIFGGYTHRLAGLRIAGHAGSASVYRKRAEANQLNPFTAIHAALHRFDKGGQRSF